MSREEVLKKVQEIVADKLGVDLDEVKEDAALIDDLGADSLDLVDLVMEFEEAFNVKIEDEELEKIKTVGDIVEGIMNKLS